MTSKKPKTNNQRTEHALTSMVILMRASAHVGGARRARTLGLWPGIAGHSSLIADAVLARAPEQAHGVVSAVAVGLTLGSSSGHLARSLCVI